MIKNKFNKIFIQANTYYNMLKLFSFNENNVYSEELLNNIFDNLKLLSGLKDIRKEDISGWLDVNKDIFDKYNMSTFDMFSGIKLETCFIKNKLDEKRMLFIKDNIKSIKEKIVLSNEYFIKGFNSIKDNYAFTINHNEYINEPDYDSDTTDLQILYNESVYSGQTISAFTGHNEVLLNALKELLHHRGYRSITDSNINDFLLDNKEKIDNATKLGRGNKVILGKGVDGIAIDIGNDKVLKIFFEKYPYLMALESIKRLHNNPELADTEAMIYDADIFGNISVDDRHKITLYYSIIEKMKPLNNGDRDIQNSFRFIINDLRKYLTKRFPGENDYNFLKLRDLLKKPKTYKLLRKKINENAKQYVLNNPDILSKSLDITKAFKEDLNGNWLLKFVEEVMIKHLTGRGDLHIGNIGINSQGYLRYFDPSDEAWFNNINTGYREFD